MSFAKVPMIEPLTLTGVPPAAEGIRAAVRAFLEQHQPDAPPEQRARSWMGFDAAFSRRMAEQGWVGMTMPAQYGGAGADAFTRFVVVEELLARGAPVSAHWIADRQSGPLILKYGTDAQKDWYLPRICRAEAFFCIGMSEPQAGSDLASITTRAVKAKTGWRVSGQKLWTTNAQHSHYMIALVRTSGGPEERQRGLSQMVIDLSLPGITVRPIEDLAGDSHFNEVFFDNVALPADALIGAEGAGWEQVTSELAFERSGPERIYSSMVLFEIWLQWLRDSGTAAEGATTLVGKLVGHLATLRAMSVAVTAQLARGNSPVIEAALVKDLGTEFEQWLPAAIANAIGADPTRIAPDSLLRTLAYLMQISPSFSLRGGTREILRGMIARGLGLR
ncbi:MAG: acyl-CoA dehydrogenase family protein [Burkholderiaceae bacterium]